MWASVRMCMGCMSVHKCVGPEANTVYLPWSSHLRYWGRVSHLNLESPIQLDWLLGLPWDSISDSWGLWLQTGCYPSTALCGCWVSQCQLSYVYINYCSTLGKGDHVKYHKAKALFGEDRNLRLWTEPIQEPWASRDFFMLEMNMSTLWEN